MRNVLTIYESRQIIVWNCCMVIEMDSIPSALTINGEFVFRLMADIFLMLK